MPNLKAHEEAAERNQVVLDFLKNHDDRSPDSFAHWIITVAFYKALHLVEGMFYMDSLLALNKQAFHSKDHRERNTRLKNTKTYAHVWKHYRPLFEASMVARYLCDPVIGADQTDLKSYIPQGSVQSKFIEHYLRQIEKSFQLKKTAFEKNPPDKR